MSFGNLVYVLRSVPPSFLIDICHDYNNILRAAFSTITGISLHKKTLVQFSRSISRGGLGFRDPSKFSYIAYFASVANACTRDDIKLCNVEDIENTIDFINSNVVKHDNIQFTVSSKFKIKSVRAESSEEKKHSAISLQQKPGFSDGASTLLELPTQHSLSQDLEDKQLNELVTCADEAGDLVTLARLRSMSSKHAGSWISVIPSVSLKLNFKPAAYIILIKWWLGLPVSPTDRIYACKKCGTTLDPLGYHALTCRHGSDLICRHNIIRDTIQKACVMAGLNPGLKNPD